MKLLFVLVGLILFFAKELKKAVVVVFWWININDVLFDVAAF